MEDKSLKWVQNNILSNPRFCCPPSWRLYLILYAYPSFDAISDIHNAFPTLNSAIGFLLFHFFPTLTLFPLFLFFQSQTLLSIINKILSLWSPTYEHLHYSSFLCACNGNLTFQKSYRLTQL